MKVIEIVVSPQGQSTIVTKGFAGAECRQASKFVEEALGAKLSERLTAEFHQPTPAERERNEQRF